MEQNILVNLFEKNDLTQLSYHLIHYGSKTEFEDKNRPVLERFSHHSQFNEFWNINISSFVSVSSMFTWRNFLYLGPIIFSAHFFHDANQNWLVDTEIKKRSYDGSISHKAGCFLHFQCKTWEEYQSKITKGDVAFKVNKNNREYFDQFDFNNVETKIDWRVIEKLTKEINDVKEKLDIDSVKIEEPSIWEKIKLRYLAMGISDVAGQHGFIYKYVLGKRKNWRVKGTYIR